MKAVRLLMTGRVQGVGYRDWMMREARTRGLSGWVRNTGLDAVEAVLSGEDDAVDAMIAACRRGPPAARVADVAVSEAGAIPAPGFMRLPSL